MKTLTSEFMALGSDKALYAIIAFTNDDPREENTVTYETSSGQAVLCSRSNGYFIPSSSAMLRKLPLPAPLPVRSNPRAVFDSF